MYKLVLTQMEIGKAPFRVSALCESDRPVELRIESEQSESLLGNIYVGQVENVAENIQAAFVLIAPGVRCYLPLSELKYLRRTDGKKPGSTLRPGDQILVQVSREAMKMKLPSVSGRLNFTGQYLALSTGESGVGVSKKLESKERLRLMAWAKEKEPDLNGLGLIVRTNGAQAKQEELEQEFLTLLADAEEVLNYGIHRTVYSLLRRQDSFWIQCVRECPKAELSEIVTDLPEVHELLNGSDGRKAAGKDLSIRYYEDSLLPLYKLYRVESALEEILEKRVWLKSGGFLVIEQTEAFVSIDVNTGKFTGSRKKAEETFRRMNLEAAHEIARQLRLRNLSGSILIDFINLENPDHKEELFHVLQKKLKQDPVRTRAIDITGLNILEVTRQKIRRSLYEELKSLEIKYKM